MAWQVWLKCELKAQQRFLNTPVGLRLVYNCAAYFLQSVSQCDCLGLSRTVLLDARTRPTFCFCPLYSFQLRVRLEDPQICLLMYFLGWLRSELVFVHFLICASEWMNDDEVPLFVSVLINPIHFWLSLFLTCVLRRCVACPCHFLWSISGSAFQSKLSKFVTMLFMMMSCKEELILFFSQFLFDHFANVTR